MAKRQTVARFIGVDCASQPPEDEPAGLAFDLETSPELAHIFGLKQKYVNPHAVEKYATIICAGYKWINGDEGVLESRPVRSVVFPGTPFERTEVVFDDRELCLELAAMIKRADFIITQNGDQFDVKMLAARMFTWKMPPFPRPLSVDLVKASRRRMRFDSHSLDSVDRRRGSEGKVETPKNLWYDIMRGELDLLPVMSEYCLGDVRKTMDYYFDLRPWIDNHPNLGLTVEDSRVCPNCTSGDVVPDGVRRTRTNSYRRFRCRNCGGYSWAPNAPGRVLR